MPASFEICWNCGTGKDGTPPAEADIPSPLPALEDVANGPEEPFLDSHRMERCAQCGSERVVPAVPVSDVTQGSSNLKVAVDGCNEAGSAEDRRYGSLTAFICGDCGYTELRADNPGALYSHHRRGREDS